METKKLECAIIQDLLPHYIDGLTSGETNEFIENHLKECDECMKTCNSMKENLNFKESKEMKKEVNYLKKFNKKMTFIKTIALILSVIFFIYLGKSIYAYVVINKVYDRNVDVDLGNNFKITTIGIGGNVETIKYYKDGISKIELKRSNAVMYIDGVEAYNLIEDEKKYMELREPFNKIYSTYTASTYGLFNGIEKKDILELILFQNPTVSTEGYDQKECYVIKMNGEKLWIQKDTMFIIRDDFEGQSSQFKIEIGTVTDEDIKRPDLNEYEKINY